MTNLSAGTHTVTVDGTRYVYHVAGQGPVMIAHSGGPGVDYAYLRFAPLEEHFTMVYPEPPGTGHSGPLPAHATYVDTYVDFVHALVEHLGVPQVHLLGHSHGGFVAVRYAVRHPDRVAGLLLYSTSPETTDAFWHDVDVNTLAYPKRHPDIPATIDVVAAVRTDETGLSATDLTALLRRSLPIYFADFWGRRAEFKPLQEAVRCWPARFETRTIDYRGDLARITARTVVLTGRHDFICGPRWAHALHDGIPGSRLVILEESGHFGHLEQPEQFLSAATGLL